MIEQISFCVDRLRENRREMEIYTESTKCGGSYEHQIIIDMHKLWSDRIRSETNGIIKFADRASHNLEGFDAIKQCAIKLRDKCNAISGPATMETVRECLEKGVKARNVDNACLKIDKIISFMNRGLNEELDKYLSKLAYRKRFKK